ncbi:MAG: PDZ domain-containing protein [Clostridiales bacterium]|nr:PDZ domain-containing protein [Clostridiales bacterium]MCC8065652.1 PDZ domain-containing protein [Clostridiales bacterium]
MGYCPEEENREKEEDLPGGLSRENDRTDGEKDSSDLVKELPDSEGVETETFSDSGPDRDSYPAMEQEYETAEDQQLIAALEKRAGRRFLNGMMLGFVLGIAVVVAAAYAPGVIRKLTGKGNPGAEVLTQSSTISKLSEVQELIEAYYLNEVDGEYLESYLFKGIAAGLDDAYANYYTAEELSSVMDSTNGEYYGIGATIGTDTETGEFYVGEVYEGGPAEEGGLQPDDLVRAVDGEAASEMTLNELVTLIKSKETFTMIVYRPSEETELELTITCADVIPTYVTYEMLEDGIAYLKLTEFTASAVEQFRDAVADLNSQGMENLIVDLRDNPGGLLSAVCDILDEILPEDALMVYTEDKNGNREEYTADDEQSVTCQVAVLVNGGSASASEIFAGAIQDYGIGPVIGTQTYGKGVVQKTYSLSDGSAFKMTVENYYTPNGQEIDGNGITPDIIVDEDDKENKAAEDEPAESDDDSAENDDVFVESDGDSADEDASPLSDDGDIGDVDEEIADDTETDAVLLRALEELRNNG